MRKRKAFTLVEILVVVLIIAILLAIVVPAALRGRGQAQIQECKAGRDAVNAAVRLCLGDGNTEAQCNTIAALTGGTGNYLSAPPVCEDAGATTCGIASFAFDESGSGTNETYDFPAGTTCSNF